VIVTTVSKKFQIVIPKEIREKLDLSPKQRLHVWKDGVITLCRNSRSYRSRGCPRRT
jgi:AbrB family looped-hinge helix DNA binding protein